MERGHQAWWAGRHSSKVTFGWFERFTVKSRPAPCVRSATGSLATYVAGFVSKSFPCMSPGGSYIFQQAQFQNLKQKHKKGLRFVLRPDDEVLFAWKNTDF